MRIAGTASLKNRKGKLAGGDGTAAGAGPKEGSGTKPTLAGVTPGNNAGLKGT